MRNHSYENELNLYVYEISFSYESMINKTHFEREAKGNSEMNYSTFSLSFTFWFWRYYIKHSRQYLITFSNISRLIKNTSQSVVFSTLLVFGNVVKHGHSCYIYITQHTSNLYQCRVIKFFFSRLQVSPDYSHFATASDDGSVKLWDLQKLDGRSLINKSRQTYSRQGTASVVS